LNKCFKMHWATSSSSSIKRTGCAAERINLRDELRIYARSRTRHGRTEKRRSKAGDY
jgi:hypothetical protein